MAKMEMCYQLDSRVAALWLAGRHESFGASVSIVWSDGVYVVQSPPATDLREDDVLVYVTPNLP